MLDVPLTFYYELESVDDRVRRSVIREFAQNGAKHLVLSSGLMKKMIADRRMKKIFADELAAGGLTFADAHADFGMFLDPICPVPEFRREMLLRHKLNLCIAADMGVDTITIHVGSDSHYPEHPLEEQFEFLRRSFDEFLPLAEELGITICVENIWHRISAPKYLLALKKLYPTDALGFCFDAGHANLMDKGRKFPDSRPRTVWPDGEPEWDECILEKMLPHIVNCHLHDNDGINDQHFVPGAGTVDWEHVIGLLEQAPRLRVIHGEAIPLRNGITVKEHCESLARITGQI